MWRRRRRPSGPRDYLLIDIGRASVVAVRGFHARVIRAGQQQQQQCS